MTRALSTKGRKKLPRKTSFDTDSLVCTSWGPVHISTQEREQLPVIHLSMAELQTLIDRNIDNKSMEEACKSMGVSKTVYAGICAKAREKVTRSMIEGATLHIECPKKSLS